ncbi:MAG TPA: lipocalin family protein [Flavipsychrobacter sp.]|jgi:hypothetical protein|nr:lipocalin family protein [Flavipsychrobacter sp.]
MRTKDVLAALCCSLLVLAACNKKEDNNNNMSATAQTLVAGKWQLSTSTATVNYMGQDTTADIYSQMDDCDKDDFVLFAANGTGTVDENANKCADDQPVESFTWLLLNNDTKIFIADSNPDTLDVTELTNTQLVLKQIKLNTSGAPVTFINTYKNIQ